MTLELTPVDTTGLAEAFDDWIEFIATSHHGSNSRVNPGDAFTPLSKPLAESKVALLTTAGAHLDDQEPFHVETVAGDGNVIAGADGAVIEQAVRGWLSRTHGGMPDFSTAAGQYFGSGDAAVISARAMYEFVTSH